MAGSRGKTGKNGMEKQEKQRFFDDVHPQKLEKLGILLGKTGFLKVKRLSLAVARHSGWMVLGWTWRVLVVIQSERKNANGTAQTKPTALFFIQKKTEEHIMQKAERSKEILSFFPQPTGKKKKKKNAARLDDPSFLPL